MITFYTIVILTILCVLICFCSKSKYIQVIGVISAVILGFTAPHYFLAHTKEIDDQSYFTFQGISASIEHDQNQEAAQLREQVKAILADNKIMLSEFEEIGEAYSLYRAKYPLNTKVKVN